MKVHHLSCTHLQILQIVLTYLCFSSQDWDFLVNSGHHNSIVSEFEFCLGLDPIEKVPDSTAYSKPCTLDSTSLLFLHCPAILLSLHLVYEVCTNTLNCHSCPEMFTLKTSLHKYSSSYCYLFNV